MTTENVKRALWAAAFNTLADAITAGLVAPPTSATLWTQYVSPDELLHIADNSGPQPLKIHVTETNAWADVPVGMMLGLDMKWTNMVNVAGLSDDEAARSIRRFIIHNRECVPMDPTHYADAAKLNRELGIYPPTPEPAPEPAAE
jgi:hypothetical protein